MPELLIRCPNCLWEPDESCRWKCAVCGNSWNTFATHGICPDCNKVYEETACSKSRGGCGTFSLHEDWYAKKKASNKSLNPLTWFQSKGNIPPVTERDMIWVNTSMSGLLKMFDTSYFKLLTTSTPGAINFDGKFSGTEENAFWAFERLTSIMHIDTWEIQLMFYSNAPTEFSEGIVATPSDKLKGSWKSSVGKYVDKGFGDKEIWIELSLLSDPVDLIATMAHELAHYKLLGEYRMEENDELITDLTAVAFGFGIFMGNSYFNFSQWTGTTHQGWQMQKRGYLPEQVIAYAVAWIALYRNEEISWKRYLNKTMTKYFEQSYKYIINNKAACKIPS